MFPIHSSRTEISDDDDASDVSEDINVKEEKVTLVEKKRNGKGKRKAVIEETQESPTVESDKDEDDEESDEEAAADQYGPAY